eukprot:GFUD01042469.1.p1 GENE.GFUD01042469.1~~GFUD01042469.1.p1  ORF type:complete len:314 (+),score=89.58 GFUD01042469.1:135-1076(+)
MPEQIRTNKMSKRNLIEFNTDSHSTKSSESLQRMSSKSKDAADGVEAEEKPAPKMMKGGIRDRSLKSWIRILLVSTVWWAFVAGFTSLCFLLMNEILYGSDDAMPYFARDFAKYPGILDQPGLNIKCESEGKEDRKSSAQQAGCNTNSLSIGINKIYNWKPETYNTTKDNPEVNIHEGKANMKEDMKEMGVGTFPEKNLVYVTCNGRKQADKDNLKGMKVTGLPGFEADGFPWLGKNSSKTWLKTVTVDLSSSHVAKSSSPSKVFMECRAWAKNIKLEERFVDKKVPNGGGLIVLCFDGHGKIVNIGKDADCL